MKSPLTSLRPQALLPESTRQLLRAVGRRFHDGRCAQVAASLALILIPIALVGGAIATWRLRRKMREAGIDPQNPFGAPGPGHGRVETIEA